MQKILYLLIFIFIFILLSACDKGLSPSENELIPLNFPQEPQGGNPIGNWSPSGTNPVMVTILDYEQIPDMVDSLIINTTLEGYFELEVANTCSIEVIMTLNPQVYLQGSSIPLTLSIADTISGNGPYRIIDDIILNLPVTSTSFQLDTLGFTAVQDSLDLISLPNMFNYQQIIEFPIYFVFHLTRSSESVPSVFSKTFTCYRKKEDE